MRGGRQGHTLERTSRGAAMALVALALLSSEAEGAFGFRKVITVQAGQVAGGPHANFPLLVSLVDPNLATVPNGARAPSIVRTTSPIRTCAGGRRRR